MVDGLLTRVDTHGLGPVMQALIRSDTTDPSTRPHGPTSSGGWWIRWPGAGRGVDEAQLHAEVVVSALIGISLGRALGWFEDLKAVPREQLVALITDLLSEG